MSYDYIIAMIGGLLGTTVMTSMMLYGRKLNLPAVDAHGILGFILDANQANPLGYVMHWIMGAIFAIPYAIVYQTVSGNIIILSIGLGIIHWLIVGWMFNFAPLIHAGMKAGTIEPTGAYMLKSLGVVGFIAGTVGHIAFGITVGLTYLLLGGTLALA